MNKSNLFMEPVIYYLTDDFYPDLSKFTKKILLEAKQYLTNEIKSIREFQVKEKDNILSDEEYIIEFIMAGIFLDKYSIFAANTSSLSISAMNSLNCLYKNKGFLKINIDEINGYLTFKYFQTGTGSNFEYTRTMFFKFIKWLEATDDFYAEAKRLEKWAFYLESVDAEKSMDILNRSVAFAHYFEDQAKIHLGKYTLNVKRFIQKELTKYKNREDYLFCGSPEVIYYLNMFVAEALNH